MVVDISSIGGTTVVEVSARKVFERLSRLECAYVGNAKTVWDKKCRVTRFGDGVGEHQELRSPFGRGSDKELTRM